MNALKKVILPLACRYLLSPRGFYDLDDEIKCIKCSSKDISLLTQTSNNVMEIMTESGMIYFRECKLHKELYQYIMDEIDFYYSHICFENPEAVNFLKKMLANSKNLRKFANMGMTNDKSSGAYKFCMGKGGAFIGLKNVPAGLEENLKDFVQYIWGDLFAYKLNSGIKLGQYQIYNAVRCIGTYRMAKLLGLESLIPETEYAIVCVDNSKKLFGTVMKQASGVGADKIAQAEKEKIITPSLQRMLNNLNILDVICLEKDHRPSNYNIVIDKNKAHSVVAFDNDSPNSFGLGGINFATYAGCSPWIVEGRLNRPYIDRGVADNIINLDEQMLFDEMNELLNSFQLHALQSRIEEVKKVLRDSSYKFLDESEWNIDTINEELSGKYGNTYLTQFLKQQKAPYQPWIKSNDIKGHGRYYEK